MLVLGLVLGAIGLGGIATVCVKEWRRRSRVAAMEARLVRLGRAGQHDWHVEAARLAELERRVRARAEERIVSDEQTGAAA